MSRVLAIIPTIVSLIASYIYFRSSSGQEFFIIFILFFIVLPLSMIWFPQAYAGKTNWFIGRLSSENSFIVLFGWLFLMIPTVVLLFLAYRSI